MVASSFSKALKFLLADEGGNDDDPLDHGGRTSRGVTQREYSAWRHAQGLADNDVWKASDDEISTIYRDEYWLPFCDSFPVGVDYLYFDLAVNAGPRRAAVLLQRALSVPDDGRIGPITRQKAMEAEPRALIEKFTQKKRDFYISLHQPRFTKGWLNRCNNVRANALSML